MTLRSLVPWSRGRAVPVRRQEESPFLTLHREMNRLFDRFLGDWDWWSFPSFFENGSLFRPRVDLHDRDDALVVTVDLPGVEEKDLDISLSSNALTIRGERKEEREEKEAERYHAERAYGFFERVIPLPCEVQSDKVEAHLRRGVLTITLPKTDEARRSVRRIPVKAA